MRVSESHDEEQGKKIHEFIDTVDQLTSPLLWPRDPPDRIQDCYEKYIMERLHDSIFE